MKTIRKRIVVELKDIDVDVSSASVPTLSDLTNISKNTLSGCGCCWWLATPGSSKWTARYVNAKGDVSDAGANVVHQILGVRPVIHFTSRPNELEAGDSIKICGYSFTVISENAAIADEIIQESTFSYHGTPTNDYQCSKIKDDVNRWYEHKIKPYLKGENYE